MMLDKFSPTSKYALGSVRMIMHSILEYKRNHPGKLPKRIELHPIVLQDFSDTLRRVHPRFSRIDIATGAFLGVPIIQNPNADQPRLINYEGEIEHL